MTEPTELESPVDRIIGELSTGVEVVDAGGFTLDPAAAAAKLERFAYADRSSYLVALVEGVLGLGASAVEIATVGEDLVVRARELRLEQPEPLFVDVYAHAFGSAGDARSRALGRLAVSLDMVLGAEQTRVVSLRYATLLVEYRRREAPQPRAGQPDCGSMLELVIDHGWTLQGAEASSPALERLREAVRHSPAAVELDGQRISQQPRGWFETLRGEGPGFRFTAGLAQDEGRLAVIELWSAGVCVDRLPGEGRAFQAAIELDVVRRDLGQAKVVIDDTVERALAAVNQARTAALEALEQADRRWLPGERPGAWPRIVVDEVLGRSRGLAVSSVERPRSRITLIRELFNVRQRARLSSILLASAGLLFAGIGVYAAVDLGVGDPVTRMFLGMGGLPILVSAALMIPDLRKASRAVRVRDRGIRTTAKITSTCGTGMLRVVDRTRVVEIVSVRWEFQDRHGAARRGHSSLRGRPEVERAVALGTIVVYYNPDDPDESWWEADVGQRAGADRIA